MVTLRSALLLAAALGLGLSWALFRGYASSESHRRLAVALTAAALLLPRFLMALGVVSPRSATGVGLIVLSAAVLEAALMSGRGMQPYPVWPRRAWAALWFAVLTIHFLAILKGSWPYLPQLSLVAGLGVMWWVRIDRELVERGIEPIWTIFSGAMLILLPFGVLDGANSGEVTESISEASPYWNSALSVLGLDARWSGMFAHPNALGAFSALGVGFALSRARVSWRLLVLSTPLLLVSSSRTAGIAAVAGAIAYAVIKGKIRVRLGVLVAAVLVGVITFQSLARDANAATGTGRLEVWRTISGLLGPDWLWGLGPEAGPALVQSGLLPSWAAHLHSVVFEHLLYSGVLGLASVLLLFFMLAAAVFNDRDGLPLLLVVGILALGDNYAHLFQFTLGVLGYAAVIAACTPASRITGARERVGLGGNSSRLEAAIPARGWAAR